VHVVVVVIVQVKVVAAPFLNTVAVTPLELPGAVPTVKVKDLTFSAAATVVSHDPGWVLVASVQAVESEPNIGVPSNVVPPRSKVNVLFQTEALLPLLTTWTETLSPALKYVE
jgi:hypothetical protein